ncbi:MAG: hypothetical protein V3R97_00240 [Gemmatimonadales bacterium]
MVQIDFEQFMVSVAARPYRKLVADRMSGRSVNQLAEGVSEAGERLPERLRAQAPGYIEAARDKFLRSKLFWEASTCREALANILELAAEVIEDDEVWRCHKHPFGEDVDLAGALFEVATASFAYAAGQSQDQRRLIGIKKGWLRKERQ